ncbi:hypothetical protein BESB_037460 [Besnoitia besnoiti]|uniref:Uncharacterized protein n=1 Tax=Besnoitia besnoiti TaxID=94643 RepID=A0A2A9MFL9_BESBE|nr:hypothetical protein BESB_037460 [Besnoitia besnoiti]PFH37288.1 hypothetical protein BESB_037460 [Besnoitia besnoiti]
MNQKVGASAASYTHVPCCDLQVLAVNVGCLEDGWSIEDKPVHPSPLRNDQGGWNGVCAGRGGAQVERQNLVSTASLRPRCCGVKRGRSEEGFLENVTPSATSPGQTLECESLSTTQVASARPESKRITQKERGGARLLSSSGVRPGMRPVTRRHAKELSAAEGVEAALRPEGEESSAARCQSVFSSAVADNEGGKAARRYGCAAFAHPLSVDCLSPSGLRGGRLSGADWEIDCAARGRPKAPQNELVEPVSPLHEVRMPTAGMGHRSASPRLASPVDEPFDGVGGEATLADAFYFCTPHFSPRRRCSESDLLPDYPSQTVCGGGTQKSSRDTVSPAPRRQSPGRGETQSPTTWANTTPDAVRRTPTGTGEEDVTAAVDAARAATAALFADLHTGFTPCTSPTAQKAVGLDQSPRYASPPSSRIRGSPAASSRASCSLASAKSRSGRKAPAVPLRQICAKPLLCGIGLSESYAASHFANSQLRSSQGTRLSVGSVSSVDSNASETSSSHPWTSGCLRDDPQYPIVLQQACLAAAMAAGEASCPRTRVRRRTLEGKRDCVAKPVQATAKKEKKRTTRNVKAKAARAGVHGGLKGEADAAACAGPRLAKKTQKAQQQRRKTVEQILLKAEEEKVYNWWRDDEVGDKLEGEESEEEDEVF